MSLASVVCLSVCPNLDSDFHFAMRLKSLKSKCIKKTLNNEKTRSRDGLGAQ